ncbi:hypothetical protein F4054_01135 [Candidatus Poribacteria bacterium]|nr:hypothetical protein [Candidatus Poribacteria bacterium]MYG08109.1 hypothetical protein [Candidatus Poribacteria bacterium]MYK20845.1 hypothetical protein [Candidatus Poribacteria bacterium]
MLTDASGAVYALTVDRNHLYVGTGPDIIVSESTGLFPKSTPETQKKRFSTQQIGGDLVQSSDGGETWESVRFNAQKHTPELDTDFYNNIRLTIADNLLYVISVQEGKPSICDALPTHKCVGFFWKTSLPQGILAAFCSL